MALVFVVRHGETEGNEKMIYRGRWDLPLNVNGKEQVRKVGETLKTINLGAVYTSPLKRAIETASDIIEGRAVKTLIEKAFIDIDYGDWTKLPEKDVVQKYPDLHRQWKKSPESVVFPNGEGLKDVRRRVEPALVRLAESHQRENIVIVSHRVTIKVIICIVLGLDISAFWKVQVDTASISVIEFNEDLFSLILSNETCHLKSLSKKTGDMDF